MTRSDVNGMSYGWHRGCIDETLPCPQLLNGRPEAVAVGFANPVLSELVVGGAARTDDDALATFRASLRANFERETVWRVRRGGSAG